MKRIVLFSDLHLDATFTWAPPRIARRRRTNLRSTLSNIVALADEVAADAIWSAGDLYEHEHVTPDTASFLLRTLSEASCPVILAPGNHDPLVPGSLYASAAWPSNVTVVEAARLAPVDLDDGLRLWTAAHHVTAGTPGFLDGFSVEGQAVHYALFHGSESLGIAREGERKEAHAPFTVEQIERSGLTHAFVGHYHTPADGPWHTYPGNPDPLTFGEQGERGAVVIEIDRDGTFGRQRHVVAVSQVADITVDVTGAHDASDITARVWQRIDGFAGEVRVTLSGSLAPHVDVRVDDIAALSTDDLTVVPRLGRIGVDYDLERLAAEQSVRGHFVRAVEADPTLDEDQRRRVLITGLRALDGRDDLEVA